MGNKNWYAWLQVEDGFIIKGDHNLSKFPSSWQQIFEKLWRVKFVRIEISYDFVVIEGYQTQGLKSPMESFPSINLQSEAGWEYACLSQKMA